MSKRSRLRLLLLPPLEQHRYPQRNGDGDAGTDAHHSELHRHRPVAIATPSSFNASAHQPLVGLVHPPKRLGRSAHVRMVLLHQTTMGSLDRLGGRPDLQTEHSQSV